MVKALCDVWSGHRKKIGGPGEPIEGHRKVLETESRHVEGAEVGVVLGERDTTMVGQG